jgi:hypothetical protein
MQEVVAQRSLFGSAEPARVAAFAAANGAGNCSSASRAGLAARSAESEVFSGTNRSVAFMAERMSAEAARNACISDGR